MLWNFHSFNNYKNAAFPCLCYVKSTLKTPPQLVRLRWCCFTGRLKPSEAPARFRRVAWDEFSRPFTGPHPGRIVRNPTKWDKSIHQYAHIPLQTVSIIIIVIIVINIRTETREVVRVRDGLRCSPERPEQASCVHGNKVTATRHTFLYTEALHCCVWEGRSNTSSTFQAHIHTRWHIATHRQGVFNRDDSCKMMLELV